MKSPLKKEPVILEEARHLLLQNDVQGALQTIFDAMRAYQIPENGATGFTASLPRLDTLCQEIGSRFLNSEIRPNSRKGKPLDVYLMTEIYDTGGHTGLIGDYVANSPDRQAVLLLSNALNQNPPPAMAIARTGISSEYIEKCPHDRLLEQTRWMIARLEELQPNRLFILNHPYDPVPIAAAQPGLARWIYYVHHADHTPALGVSLRCTSHFDLTPRAMHCCRSLLKVPNTVYLPLQCYESPTLPHPINGSVLSTASSGSSHKFSWKGPTAYPSIIKQLLGSTSGSHFHIGPLAPQQLRQWRTNLTEMGIAQDRLVYVPHVSSLWQAMHDLKIDLYLHSFPLPGARAAVEVMGSGTPILHYSPLDNPLQSSANLVYPESKTWSTTEQLIALVNHANGEWLATHRKYSRRYYEKNHARGLLLPAFQKDPIAGPDPFKLDPLIMEFFRDEIDAYCEKFQGIAKRSLFQKWASRLRLGLEKFSSKP